MGMFGRMNTILQSKMSKVLDKAENPNETLDYSYEKQLQLLQNVKRGLADLVTAKRRLQLAPSPVLLLAGPTWHFHGAVDLGVGAFVFSHERDRASADLAALGFRGTAVRRKLSGALPLISDPAATGRNTHPAAEAAALAFRTTNLA